MVALLPRLFGDVSSWFENLPNTNPTMRVEDETTDREYRLRAELPGLDPAKDVQITVLNGVLAVRAERREGEPPGPERPEQQRREQDRGLSRSEFRYGMVHRSVRLPVTADEEHIGATYRDGILEITVPLTAPELAGRLIPVARAEPGAESAGGSGPEGGQSGPG